MTLHLSLPPPNPMMAARRRLQRRCRAIWSAATMPSPTVTMIHSYALRPTEWGAAMVVSGHGAILAEIPIRGPGAEKPSGSTISATNALEAVRLAKSILNDQKGGSR